MVKFLLLHSCIVTKKDKNEVFISFHFIFHRLLSHELIKFYNAMEMFDFWESKPQKVKKPPSLFFCFESLTFSLICFNRVLQCFVNILLYLNWNLKLFLAYCWHNNERWFLNCYWSTQLIVMLAVLFLLQVNYNLDLLKIFHESSNRANTGYHCWCHLCEWDFCGSCKLFKIGKECNGNEKKNEKWINMSNL